MVISLDRTEVKVWKGDRRSIAKAGLALTVALGSLLSIAQPGRALSEDELYGFCSRYPQNSQCEGYDIPIPLSRREGEEGICALNVQEIALTDRCKVLLGAESLTVYIEQGEAIAPLDDERRTEEFTMGLDRVAALTYREDESVNRDRMLTNTVLFGLLGALLTQPDKISQIDIQFADKAATEADTGVADDSDLSSAILEETPAEIAEDNSAEAVEANTPTPTSSGNLVFETGREQGRSMSDRIGQVTGIAVRTSL